MPPLPQPPKFLTPLQINLLNALIEGPTTSRLLSAHLLASATDSPANQQHYGNVQDIPRLAAALCVKVVRNHVFANGNKRTALLAGSWFLFGGLRESEKRPVDGKEVFEKAFDDVAMGKLDQEGLAEIFRRDGGDD